jgi:matrixin
MRRSTRIALILYLALFCSGTFAQPAGYEFLQHRGKVVRHPIESLPWRIHASDQVHFEALLHAVRSWNAVGHRLGYPDLFAVVVDLSNADMVVDWSGRGLPVDKAGGVWWIHGVDDVRISKMVMDPWHKIPEGNRAQILLQELGHILGLGDSSDRRDIMHTVMDTRHHRKIKSAKLTARDIEAFRWLYSQEKFVPIVSASRGQSTVVLEQPAGPTSNQLLLEPIKVELTGSVNVRLFLKNPTDQTLRAPMALELYGRGRGESQWLPLKTWSLEKVPAGFRVSRDYFSDNTPLFTGNFELLGRVHRTDTKEVLAERQYP